MIVFPLKCHNFCHKFRVCGGMYYFTSGGDGLAIEYRKLEPATEYSEYLGRHPLAEEHTSREA